jgi:flagellar biosynthesis protein
MEEDSKIEQAIALQYQAEDELPELVAKGLGEVARRIEDIAVANNIPIERNRDALQALSCLKVGQSINEESFPMIAEVIAFLYHVDVKWREGHEFLAPILED